MILTDSSDRGLMLQAKGSGALNRVSYKHRNIDGALYLMKPGAYFPDGSIALPCGSTDFSILKQARIEPTVSQMDSLAIWRPGLVKVKWRGDGQGLRHSPNAPAVSKGDLGVSHRRVELSVLGEEAVGIEPLRVWIDGLIVQYCPD